ncbi:MAG: chemotaxis response regulator protein-glutamate methylesterase [Nitrospirae bacterium]|nr:chemotaxis response regulator protein-glutamate methylesterase [Nitrospirota bacterium]
MSKPIQVLIVDDSVVIRRSVSSLLAKDSDIQVIGTASNGKIALEQIALLKPEVIVLDLEMPELDGFGVLRYLRKEFPRIKSVVFSTLSQRGAFQTIEALSLGASDYSTKPSSMAGGADDLTLAKVSEELIRKVKQFRTAGNNPLLPEKKRFEQPLEYPKSSSSSLKNGQPPKVVAIGISTGGPEALLKMLPGLAKDVPVPILIVQHMPPLFTKILSDRLATSCQIKVVEAAEGMKVERGTAYIAPGNFHMEVHQVKDDLFITLNQNPHENSCRPSADVLFRSVAKCFGGESMGVIMTGMGQDGFKGLREMKDKGAVILAQDEASSVVWGMPSYVVRDGMADQVVPLIKMSSVISGIVARAVPSSAH